MLKNLENTKIILASGSPRRQQFLKDLGLRFEIRLKDTPENYPSGLVREEITDYLARLKAEAFLDELNDNELLITADTIVWLDGKALGKPNDLKEAKDMLRDLSGKMHEVISSFCLISRNKEIVKNEITRVYFKNLEPEEIKYYTDHFATLDKAGSYGIQDWIGLVGISHIEGSYFNVMGLPTSTLYECLKRF